MKIWLNFFIPFVLIGQTSTFLIACSEPMPPYISNNNFENIKRIDTNNEHIENIFIKDNTIYAATFTGDNEKKIKIYHQINNNFEALNTDNINENDWKNLHITLMIDDDNNIFLVSTDKVNFHSTIYAYNNEKKAFEEKIDLADKSIETIFFNKSNSDDKNIYYIIEEQQNDEEYTKIYKSKDIVSDLELVYAFDEPFTPTPSSWATDKQNNIYIGSVVENSEAELEGKIFKIDIEAAQLIATLDFPDTPHSIAIHNETLYVIGEDEHNTNIIYQQINDKNFEKKITTSWKINSIIIDENNHLFAGGRNDHLYSGIINESNITNFNIISNQNFKGIEILVYQKDMLVVSSKNGIFQAKPSEFTFS